MFKGLVLGSIALALSASAAFAADLPTTKGPPVYVPPPPPPPIFSWTGAYIGAQVGYQWGQTTWDVYNVNVQNVVIADEPTGHPGGISGGIHVGYDYQFNQFVFGVEGDVNGSGYRGSVSSNGGTHELSTRNDINGSVRGRIGYAFDRVLVYGTAGLAIAPFQITNSSATGEDVFNRTLLGWTAGAGVEYAINNNWSVRAEYRYTDYRRFAGGLVNSVPGSDLGNHYHLTNNLAQVGASYKFDIGGPVLPVVSKY